MKGCISFTFPDRISTA